MFAFSKSRAIFKLNFIEVSSFNGSVYLFVYQKNLSLYPAGSWTYSPNSIATK